MATGNQQGNSEDINGRNREDFIDNKEVARRLGAKPRTIDNWMRQKWLPFYKIGRFVRFKWSEVEAAIRKRRNGGD